LACFVRNHSVRTPPSAKIGPSPGAECQHSHIPVKGQRQMLYTSSMLRRTLGAIGVLGVCVASCKGGGPTTPDDPAGIALSTTSLSFSGNETQRQVTLRNLGSGPVEWRLEAATAPWVNTTPSYGSLQPGGTGTLSVRIDRGILSGTSQHSASLEFRAADNVQSLQVTVESPPPVAGLNPGQLSIGPQQTSGSLEVVNTGGSTLQWAVTGPAWAGWLDAPVGGYGTGVGSPQSGKR